MAEEVVLLHREDGVAVMVVNRPQVLNALNREVLVKMREALRDIGSSRDIGVLIVTGAGDRAFAAGADISEMLDMNPDQAKEFSRFGQETFQLFREIPQPVIAAVNGYALGGGMELALSCDIRVASETARFGQPEVGLGIIPGFGGTQRLSRLVGEGRAKDLIFTGRYVTAREALEMGLVEYVVPEGEALSFARKLAAQMLEKSPAALKHAKAAIARGLERNLEEGLGIEAAEFAACFAVPDQREGMTAFLEKRKPSYR